MPDGVLSGLDHDEIRYLRGYGRTTEAKLRVAFKNKNLFDVIRMGQAFADILERTISTQTKREQSVALAITEQAWLELCATRDETAKEWATAVSSQDEWNIVRCAARWSAIFWRADEAFPATTTPTGGETKEPV